MKVLLPPSKTIGAEPMGVPAKVAWAVKPCSPTRKPPALL